MHVSFAHPSATPLAVAGAAFCTLSAAIWFGLPAGMARTPAPDGPAAPGTDALPEAQAALEGRIAGLAGRAPAERDETLIFVCSGSELQGKTITLRRESTGQTVSGRAMAAPAWSGCALGLPSSPHDLLVAVEDYLVLDEGHPDEDGVLSIIMDEDTPQGRLVALK